MEQCVGEIVEGALTAVATTWRVIASQGELEENRRKKEFNAS
jgi:hypothetical protein